MEIVSDCVLSCTHVHHQSHYPAPLDPSAVHNCENDLIIVQDLFKCHIKYGVHSSFMYMV